MTTRIYDIYDLSSAFVEPTAPATAAPTAAKRAAPDRLLCAGAYLLTFAGAVLLLAVLAAFTPVGRIDADITVPFVVVTVGTLAVIAWGAVTA